ncbi:MAG: response regulator [Verrucomicrobia bacterium]|nr:response regulator [Verrucomicrobiota bacterium]
MSTEQLGRPAEILLAEDNPGDVRRTHEALKEAGVQSRLHVVPDGVETMAFLLSHGAYANAPRPDLILLDLNIPRMDGREVLKQVKGDENLRRIPVVVVTSSQAEEDIREAYALRANCYVTNPVDLDQFMKVMKGVWEFWLTVVKLPPQ